ncbi:phosphoenolpyruvate--protein phosphotransferase [Spiroplasma endosymbiont of Aspidapion aeneum]|uniref:phosphoenolpyruvate--protein phosphotransferase n=1 Tax=Spiroplasma endosymbiont of Aspidapion aeneum TaxID=3066276 RepID=UPI00313BEC68
MSKKFQGIGASDGISISSVLLIEEEEIIIPEDEAKNIDKEISILNECVKKTKADLVKLKEEATNKLGQDKGDIFEAHISILEDPEFEKQTIDKIKKLNYNSAKSVSETANEFISIFAAMEDPYLRERAADVKDVTTRLIKMILNIKIVDFSTIEKEVIIVSDDLTPSQTSQLNPKFVKGFLCNIGGRTSHAAIMARSLEIPAVLGLKDITKHVKDNDVIAIDGNAGIVELNPASKNDWLKKEQTFKNNIKELVKFKSLKTLSKDGYDKFVLEGNIGSPKDVSAVLENGGEGIGLFRSEFLYMDNDHFPTEDEQFQAYKSAIEQVDGKIVVIRTLDIGGDKKLNYFSFPKETNPFLGYRAVRFTLDKQDIFKVQLRALLRASAFGKLGIMFPMIATIDEFKKSKALVEECKTELIKEKVKVGNDYEVGMMVEIPATAAIADKFAKYADFFSVGTNDLIQYTMAADRMSEKVSYLYQPLNPSILRLLKLTIDGGHKHNRWVGMCGEMAGEPNAVPILMGLGLDAFSMSATSIPKARSIISKWTRSEAKELAEKALDMETQKEVIDLVEKFSKNK